jgi:hypothetical protein
MFFEYSWGLGEIWKGFVKREGLAKNDGELRTLKFVTVDGLARHLHKCEASTDETNNSLGRRAFRDATLPERPTRPVLQEWLVLR